MSVLLPDLNVCGRDKNRERKTQGIYQQVPLAALDVLVGIAAARSGGLLGGLDALRESIIAADGSVFLPTLCLSVLPKAL